MDDKKAKKTAGALDVRNIIGMLIGIYGVILVVLGIFSDSRAAKTGDVNANLWAGLVMILAALAFAVWTRLRPVIVDEKAVAEAHAAQEDDGPAH